MTAPNDVILKVNADVLPQGFCAQSYQELANAFANIYSVTLPSQSDLLHISPTAPTGVGAELKIWLQLDTLGRPVRFYYFAQTKWLSPHPIPTGTIVIRTDINGLTDAQIWALDGGDGTPNPLGSGLFYSGAMWEVASELNALFPVGSQNGSATSKFASGATVNPGDKAGEEKHTLTSDELATHNHFVANKDQPNSGAGSIPNSLNTVAFSGSQSAGSTTDYVLLATATRADRGMTSDAGGVAGVTTGHNTLPPYLGVVFLRKTPRLYYTS